MNFWQEHKGLRLVLITISLMIALALIFTGWYMTGEMSGLLRMILGLIFLLVSLSLYNKPYEDKKL